MSEQLDPSDFNIPSTDELRRLRLLAGKTQVEVAERLGVTQSTVWRWEQDDRSPTTAQAREMLACYRGEDISNPEDSGCPMCGEENDTILDHLPTCPVNELDERWWALED